MRLEIRRDDITNRPTKFIMETITFEDERFLQAIFDSLSNPESNITINIPGKKQMEFGCTKLT